MTTKLFIERFTTDLQRFINWAEYPHQGSGMVIDSRGILFMWMEIDTLYFIH